MTIHPLLVYIGFFILFLCFCGYVLSILFVRSTKNLAYVRTGHGGEKVILNDGDFVLPILHKAIPVSLISNAIEINQFNENSVITKDRLRADITVVFYLKVNPVDLDIIIAAQTLGRRTMDPVEINAFLSSQLTTSIRQAAIDFTLAELQINQQNFVSRVRDLSVDQLLNYGVVLETISVVFLGQSDKSCFDPDNIIDAKGLTKITELVESEKKLRNDLEQDARIEIYRKQTEADQLIQKLKQEKLKQKYIDEQEIITHETTIKVEKHKGDARTEYEKEQARILVDQKVKLSEQNREIALADNAKNQVQIYVDASLAKARIVTAEEEIVTGRELAKAERVNQIELIQARGDAERETISIREKALAEKQAAEDKAEAYRILAKGKADALKIIAEGKISISAANKETVSQRNSIHLDGLKSLLELCNVLSNEKYSASMRSLILDSLSKAITESDKLFDPATGYDSLGKNLNTEGKDLMMDSRTPSESELNDPDVESMITSSKILNLLKAARESTFMEAVAELNRGHGSL